MQRKDHDQVSREAFSLPSGQTLDNEDRDDRGEIDLETGVFTKAK